MAEMLERLEEIQQKSAEQSFKKVILAQHFTLLREYGLNHMPNGYGRTSL